MKRFFIYPNNIPQDKTLFNPYITDLTNNLSEYFEYLNPEPTNKGIFELFLKAGKTDFLFLNWVENLPERKLGLLQTMLFVAIVYYLKFTGKKVIWTIHNKFSHSKKKYKTKRWLTKFLIRNSDYMITHSSEGVRFAESITKNAKERTKYLPHPIKDFSTKATEKKIVDILIWGSIARYKGIHLFLSLLHEKKLQNDFNILIAGKVVEKSYLSEIKKYLNENIKLDNRFLSHKELSEIIPASRVVIFPYQKDSILSSGVLMDTIAQKGIVLGPNVAAFADLKEVDIIETYSDFEDMIIKIRKIIAGDEIVKDNELEKFILENSWEQFTRNIVNWIDK